jgi:hypothetical protein
LQLVEPPSFDAKVKTNQGKSQHIARQPEIREHAGKTEAVNEPKAKRHTQRLAWTIGLSAASTTDMAMADSEIRAGRLTIPSVARLNVSECARVKAVTIFSSIKAALKLPHACHPFAPGRSTGYWEIWGIDRYAKRHIKATVG